MKGEAAGGERKLQQEYIFRRRLFNTQAAFCWTRQEADDTILPLHPTSDKITLCLARHSHTTQTTSKSGQRPRKEKKRDREKTAHRSQQRLAEYQEWDRNKERTHDQAGEETRRQQVSVNMTQRATRDETRDERRETSDRASGVRIERQQRAAGRAAPSAGEGCK